MMKKRFRAFIGFLFAALLSAVFLTSCNTEHADVPSQGLKFRSNGDGTCALVGMGTCMDTDLVIPSEHNGDL